jgi:hypothetical protein
MKKLIIALTLALTALSAHADKEFRYSPNQDGGYIYLTYDPCVNKKTGQDLEHIFSFYATSNGGQIISNGCYYYENNMYHARYSNGVDYVWNADSFEPIGVGR